MSEASTARKLQLDGVHNIRDLGGLLRDDRRTTRRGRAYRACGMDGLSAAGEAALLRTGVGHVIDLRSPAEVAAIPGPFHTHPGRREVSLFEGLAPLAQCLRQAPQAGLANRYILALKQAPAQFARVFRLIAQPGDRPVLFHCTAGKDRTGLIAALLLALNQVEYEQIVQDYAATATLGADLLARLRARALLRGDEPALVEQALRSDAATMAQVLTWIDSHHGSVAGYLSATGLDADSLDRLARML